MNFANVKKAKGHADKLVESLGPILGILLVIIFVAIGLAIVFGIWALIALLLQWVWNHLMVPAGFGQMTFWLAFGVVVLKVIFFGKSNSNGKKDKE